MDRKAIAIVTFSILLMLLWAPLVNRIYYGTWSPPPRTNLVQTITNVPAPATTSTTTTTSPIRSVVQASSGGAPVRSSHDSATLLALTNNEAIYTFSSIGGGLQTIGLRRYPENVECRQKGSSSTSDLARLNSMDAIAVLSIAAGTNLLADQDFKLTAAGGVVTAEATTPAGIAITKQFSLGSNYLVHAKVRLQNQSGAAVVLPEQEWSVGTAAPMGTNDAGQSVGVFWYDGNRAEDVKESWFDNRSMGCSSTTPRSEYRGGQNNVAWAAAHNQFFTLTVMPAQPAAHVVVHQEPLTNGAIHSTLHQRQFPAAIVYPQTVLTNGQAIEREFTIYAGPKEYNTLARIGNERKNSLDLVMDFGRFFGFFAKALLLSMNGLHALSLPYGLAIVVITVIIKLLFWPLTTASTRSMKRMQKLQPQMKAIQEKYKEDPRKMNMKVMEFMKEHKVSPLGGCLPMLLQIPVFIGFYQMLQSAIELRGAGFLWACDLSRPDTIFTLGGFPVNPMPMIMGVTMLWQARLTPPSPGMDPMQQKIMKYMPLMFIVFLYKMSSGLTLYWTVQNLLSIAQMKLTRTDEEAAGASAPPPARPMPPKRKKQS